MEKSRLSPIYQKRLLEAWLLLRQVAGLNTAALETVEATTLDARCAAFVQWCFDKDRGISTARHGLLAAQWRCRRLRGHLTRSWDAIKSWQLQLQPTHRTPIQHQLLETIFVWSILQGLEHPREAHLFICFGILISASYYIHTYLA